jgi:type IV secretory pathway TraG/TraD family ATPase VirD4
MSKTNTSQAFSSIQFTPQQAKEFLTSTNGMMLLGSLTLFVILALLGGTKKGKLATSYWGGGKEKTAAAKIAKKQLKAPQRNSAALYLGTPPSVKKQLETDWYQRGITKTKPQKQSQWFGSSSPTLYIPDVQRGISVIGAAGSGKTFSVIDPLIRSTLDLGFPLIAYDFKYPTQTKRAVAYAMKRGYQVRIFAPGFPESDTCNPFDFLKDSQDAIAAGQLAQVINRNLDRTGGKGSGDKFFEDAGDTLVEGIFLLTKAVGELTGNPSFCDLMTASAILSLPNLPQRLEVAAAEKLNVWTSRPLMQMIAVKDSEKTVAGIIGTAQRVFQRFQKKDFIGAFCGKSTLPLDVDGKVAYFIGLDRVNRDIVGPLLAAILHMIVTRNVSRTIPRKEPLIVALDELPTLYLPNLVNWLNENREDGFCGILGYQNVGQLEKFYGKELSRAIIGGTATKFLFNPQDPESAKFFADLLGEQEIKFETTSRSSGGKGGTSRNRSEQFQKRYLLEPAEFAKLGTGRAVIISPGYSRAKEAYVPLLQTLKVPQSDLEEQAWATEQWDVILPCLQQRNQDKVSDAQRLEQFEERRALVTELFPLPTEMPEQGAVNQRSPFDGTPLAPVSTEDSLKALSQKF